MGTGRGASGPRAQRDARRPFSLGGFGFEVHAFHQRVGHHREIGARHSRPEERLRRADANAPALVHLEVGGPEIVAAVELRDLRNPALLGRVPPSVENGPVDSPLLDPQFAADRSVLRCSVAVVGAVLVVLRALEDRQHVVPTPAAIAELRPVVVVAGLPAHVDHGIDRRAATEHLAAGVADGPAVQTALRRGLETPVRARIADRVQVADRDVDPEVVVVPSGFDQEHALSGVR